MTIYDLLEKYKETYEIDDIRFNQDDISILDECDKSKYELVRNIISLYEDYRNPNELFRPQMCWNGKRTFDLVDLSDDDYETLFKLEEDRLPVVISTRIFDVLWVMKKDHQSARKAVAGYKFLFENTYDNTQWTTCADMICRALHISARLGKKTALFIDVCETIKDTLKREDGNDPLFLSVVLLNELIAQKYGVYSDYLELSDKIILNAKKNSANQHKVEESFKSKKQLLLWGKQSTHDCDMELVSYYEAELENSLTSVNNLYISINNVKTAIHIARNCKEQEKATELLKKLEVLQKRVPEQMAKISHSVDLTEPHEKIVKLFEGTDFIEDLLTIVRLVQVFKTEELRKSVLEKNDFSTNLFGVALLDDRGHTVLELPPLDGKSPDERSVNLHIFREIEELTNISGQTTLRWALQELNRKHTFDEKELEFIFDECAIVRPNRSKILAFGMNLALHGKIYEALHILAPQTEDIFRYIAEQNGGLVYTLENNNTSSAKALSSIFDLPELNDCYDPDYLLLFRGLLNEKAGSNLRNKVAHGILEPQEGRGGSAVYFCLILLKLCAFSSHAFYQKVDATCKAVSDK